MRQKSIYICTHVKHIFCSCDKLDHIQDKHKPKLFLKAVIVNQFNFVTFFKPY